VGPLQPVELGVDTNEGDPRMGGPHGAGLRVISYSEAEVLAWREAGIPLRHDLIEAEMERLRQEALPYGKRLEEGLVVDKLDAYHAQLSARQRRPGSGIGGLRGARHPPGRLGGGGTQGAAQQQWGADQAPRVTRAAKPRKRQFTKPRLVPPEERLTQNEAIGVARPSSARPDTGSILDRVTPTVVEMQLVDLGEDEIATLAIFQRDGSSLPPSTLSPSSAPTLRPGDGRPMTAARAEGVGASPPRRLPHSARPPSASSRRRPVSASAAYWRPVTVKPHPLAFHPEREAREVRRGMTGFSVAQRTPPRPASASVSENAAARLREGGLGGALDATDGLEGGGDEGGPGKGVRMLSARVPPVSRFAAIPSPRGGSRVRPASAGQRNSPSNLKKFPSFSAETATTGERRVYMGSDARPRRLY